MLGTLRYICGHPLARRDRPAAVARYLRWQVGSRLLRAPAAMPFTDQARLLVERGMTGATGNLYCGLHEFEDMGLLLHLLRPDDLFADVGANVGSYTVLAAKVCGADVVAAEPVPRTFARLADNVAVNHIGPLVRAERAGVGREAGTLRFTAGLDTMNRVLGPGEAYPGPTAECPVRPLDDLLDGRTPVLVKVDVEGFEGAVLDGGPRTLAAPGLKAVLIEAVAAHRPDGAAADDLHARMLGLGFRPRRYDPFTRRLGPWAAGAGGNTLYLRDEPFVADRVRTAAPVSVYGRPV